MAEKKRKYPIEENRIVILSGAGLSCAVGMPKTEDLTSEIVASLLLPKMEESFYTLPAPENEELRLRNKLGGVSLLVRKTCNLIKKSNDFAARPPMNYEQLFYVFDELSKLHDFENENYLIASLASIWAKTLDLKTNPYDDMELADVIEFSKYSRDMIVIRLIENLMKTVDVTKPNVLDFLMPQLKSSKLTKLSFFTLNHDLVLETFLHSREISYCDGFVQDSVGDYWWTKESYTKISSKVELFKLHGSLDWQPETIVGATRFFPRVFRKDPPIGKGLASFVEKTPPLLLVGTFNKFYEYTQGIFWENLSFLADRLGKCSSLYVFGYGFGDPGINHVIYNWLDDSPRNSACIVSDNIRGIQTNIDFFDTTRDHVWKHKGLNYVESSLEEFRWEKLEE